MFSYGDIGSLNLEPKLRQWGFQPQVINRTGVVLSNITSGWKDIARTASLNAIDACLQTYAWAER